MDSNNNFSFNLQGIMAHAQGLIKSMETGDGLGLDDEGKKEFQKQMKEKGGLDKIADLKTQMEKLKDQVKKSNGEKFAQDSYAATKMADDLKPTTSDAATN